MSDNTCEPTEDEERQAEIMRFLVADPNDDEDILFLAWRQAKDLRGAGIEHAKIRALDPFLDAVAEGRIQVGENSVVVLDEVGRIGTRQLLEMFRLREQSQAKLSRLPLSYFDRQPRGEVLSHPSGWEFRVLDADARRIHRLRVRRAPNLPDGAAA